MTRFFEDLNYSSVNEDWRTEARALDLRDGDDVLCVTGSGDRVLDLLAAADVRVVAIDLAPAQNHLLVLKMAAMRLPYAVYAAFLGLLSEEPSWRVATLRQLGPHLPDDTRRFWHAHSRMVRRGVLYQGRFERWFARVSSLGRLLHPGLIEGLFGFDDLEAQRVYVRARWERPAWRRTFSLAVSPAISATLFRDPGWYAHAHVDPGPWLFDRMTAGLQRCLARDSFMASLVLRGCLSPWDLPPYLTPEGVAVIRERLDRVEVVTGDVVAFLRGTERSFDRFSLSDVPSYQTEEEFRALGQLALARARPDGRIVIRQFLTRYAAPPIAWTRDPALEEELALADRTFAYSFLIGQAGDATTT
jgi:S-adenosylmethionine-diacylglycerol 3-amino-3-carboxypropyl transferase